MICVRLCDNRVVVVRVEYVEDVVKRFEYAFQLTAWNITALVSVEEFEGFAELGIVKIDAGSQKRCLKFTKVNLTVLIRIHELKEHLCAAHRYVLLASSVHKNQIELIGRYRAVVVLICSLEL